MALAQVRHRLNYPPGGVSVANTFFLSGRFTTAGAAAPTVKSSGPFSVSAPSTGQYTITLTEPIAEYLSLDCGLWTVTANANTVRVILTPNIGTSAVPASFILETQSAAGTAANLTGPIVTFDVTFRKGVLTNR